MAVVEVTSFEVREGSESAFQHGLTKALPILMRQSGYVGHEFGAPVERAVLAHSALGDAGGSYGGLPEICRVRDFCWRVSSIPRQAGGGITFQVL